MADFCRQCSIGTLGEDFGELARITTQAQWAEGRSCLVLCEGCGPIQVDPEGNCISEDCAENGHDGTGPYKTMSCPKEKKQ